VKVIIRPFYPEVDSGIIYDSYPKALYYKIPKVDRPHSDKELWFQAIHVLLPKKLHEGPVKIACIEDAPNTILGYSVQGFIYVKKAFRDQGIEELLK
jgi:hypothetical protein